MILPFPTGGKALAKLSDADRARADQLNAIYWHARHLLETINMTRDGFTADGHVSSPLLEVTKSVCAQTMVETSLAWRDLTR